MKKGCIGFLFAMFAAATVFAAGKVTFTPVETDELFANPGIGW